MAKGKGSKIIAYKPIGGVNKNYGNLSIVHIPKRQQKAVSSGLSRMFNGLRQDLPFFARIIRSKYQNIPVNASYDCYGKTVQEIIEGARSMTIEQLMSAYYGPLHLPGLDEATSSEIWNTITTMGSLQAAVNDVLEKIANIAKQARKPIAIAAFMAWLYQSANMLNGVPTQFDISDDIFGLFTSSVGLMASASNAATQFRNAQVPEAIIGPLPLYSVQRIEVGRSDRKIKYRAIGDVFLAHQKGSEITLRIDGTLAGPMRFMYIFLLNQLQKLGETELENALDIPDAGLTDVTKYTTDIIKNKDKQLNYEVHTTFPIITQFSIMLDMYLQTIEWHRTIEDGVDVIKYHLLFRKYEEPISKEIFDPYYDNPEDPSVPRGAGAIRLFYKSGYFNREFLFDLCWKMIRMYGEMYPRMFLGGEDKSIQEIDREAITNTKMIIPSWFYKKLNFW